MSRSLYLDWEHSDGAADGRTLCPVCHAHFEYHIVGYWLQGEHKGEVQERLECWHDHDLHHRLGVAYVGRRRNPEEREALTKRLAAQLAAVQPVGSRGSEP